MHIGAMVLVICLRCSRPQLPPCAVDVFGCPRCGSSLRVVRPKAASGSGKVAR
jgi:DNA-directed RNA polymerase subunit RPC12/RpoP